jgi:lipopolysaccharide/colanic/teichoic acid biosynthesis glycosyltransferase
VLVADALGNRGPLFFRQPRVGRDGRVFTMWKFRTMSAGTARHWTAQDDDRVTRFGRVLRRTHLDELPQALNILRGDLRIVGPRPEQPHYVEELSDKIPFYDLRHVVRPGLTGWAQVKFGYAGDERDALEKLQYEFFYLRRQDLRFDQRIVLRTLRSVLGGQGHGR